MTAPTTTSQPTNTQTLWMMIVAIVLTVGSYLAWLGWSDDTSAKQVLGLIATLSVLVAIVTYRLADLGRATIATGVVSGTLTVTIWIDFASDLRGHEAVWAGPVAIFVGGSAEIGLATVTLLAWSLRRADWSPVVMAVLTVAAYLGWLGWDQQRNPDGSGPYEAWQVVGLALTLATMTAIVSWRSADVTQPLASVAVITALLTLAFSIDAATDRTPDASMWPAGAILLYGGTASGLVVATVLARGLRQVVHRQH